MKTLAASLSLLLLFAPLVSRGAAPAPAETPDAETADLQAVVNGFVEMSKEHKPTLAWRHDLAHGGLTIYPADEKTFRYSDFQPVQPFVKGPGQFYVVDVFAQGDRHQRPVYLYLLSKRGNHVKTVTAFHIVNGKPQRIVDREPRKEAVVKPGDLFR